MRKLTATITIAVAIVAAGASPAHALARGGGDPCGRLISDYQYWSSEYVTEVEWAGYETAYATYAYTQVRDTGDELQRNNC